MGPNTETERSGRRGDHFQGSVDIALGPPDKLHEQTNLGFCSEQPGRERRRNVYHTVLLLEER